MSRKYYHEIRNTLIVMFLLIVLLITADAIIILCECGDIVENQNKIIEYQYDIETNQDTIFKKIKQIYNIVNETQAVAIPLEDNNITENSIELYDGSNI